MYRAKVVSARTWKVHGGFLKGGVGQDGSGVRSSKVTHHD